MAALHNHAGSWSVPEYVDRPSYDEVSLVNDLVMLRQLLPCDVMSETDFEVMEKTIHKMVKVIQSHGKDRGKWGMIHFDIHKSNYIFNEGTLAIIDFSSCGFGFYLFDLAETFLHLLPENRKKLLDFYLQARDLNGDYTDLLETFFLLGSN